MFTTLSLISSVKDYVEITHKLIESNTAYPLETYNNLGSGLSYIVLMGKQFFLSFFNFQWFYQVYSLPITIPTIASSMVSEISVLDGYFHNAFTFLEKPFSYGDQNLFFYSLEKFTLGFINSFFLFLPTSTSSLISLRRFIVQGIEAGYLSGLGTLLGSLAWIASILFGWRFILLPWISLDILRYSLGFLLIIKYMWDSYVERRTVLDNLSKLKMVFFTFLLAFTEQTSLFPFLTNISIGSDVSLVESFPANHINSFVIIHICYLLGIGLGGLSLLYFTCWFWENPAFQFYTWALSFSNFQNFSNSFDSKEGKTKFQRDTSIGILNGRLNYKFLNFTFLYLTMICAMSNIVYFGVDSVLTKPLGFVTNDRLIDQKTLLETSFLSTKSSDRNTRMNMGRRGRRERWKKGLQRYRNFDASLYGQGIYDLFTIEDLNYGFDRFWLRRKMRNHDVPFRLFPGPWVRSFKKQLSRPRLESFSGPRLEFFRILFEQVYHPGFHEKKRATVNNLKSEHSYKNFDIRSQKFSEQRSLSIPSSFSVKLWSNNLFSTKDEKEETTKENVPNASFRRLSSFSSTSQSHHSNEMTQVDTQFPKTSGTIEKRKYIQEISALQKFLRKVTKRLKVSTIASSVYSSFNSSDPFLPSLWKRGNDLREYLLGIIPLSSHSKKAEKTMKRNSFILSPNFFPARNQKIAPVNLIYSKRWKELFCKINHSLTVLPKKDQRLKEDVLFKKLSKVANLKTTTSNLGGSLNQPIKTTASLASLTSGTNREQGKGSTCFARIAPCEASVPLASQEQSQPYSRNHLNKKKIDFGIYLGKKDQQVSKYRTFITQLDSSAQVLQNVAPQGDKNLALPHYTSSGLSNIQEGSYRSGLFKKTARWVHLHRLLSHSESKAKHIESKAKHIESKQSKQGASQSAPNKQVVSTELVLPLQTPLENEGQHDVQTKLKIQTSGPHFFSTNNVTSPKKTERKRPTDLNFFTNVFKPLTLLHPIKFYLHREKALQRKFRFYGANIFRSFGISNNAPYFRIMMKKFFYYYKPTLRWERTMRVATLKKIRRKGSRKPLRLNFEKRSLSLNGSSQANQVNPTSLISPSNVSKPLDRNENPLPLNGTTLADRMNSVDSVGSIFSQSRQGLQKPTHMYSLIGKRATRYRFQIFKDVLQHWYYSPFNRLLLKIDIDAFIRRQPFSHFLTKTEEHLLHLRRALLLDHYETLRWYTYMQHYRTMKTHIGGTKSFASRFYNQQFQGTFKKIRHLFSLTPNFSSSSLISQTGFGEEKNYFPNILKWDQPLYNEYASESNSQLLKNLLVHEELLGNNQTLQTRTPKEQNKSSEIQSLNHFSLRFPGHLNESNQTSDLVQNSKQILRKYLIQANPIRQEIILKYLHDKNYWELTQFLFNGQKTRGRLAATSESILLEQEKENLYTQLEKQELQKDEQARFKELIHKGQLKEKLWLSLLKKTGKDLYNRKALKNYLKNKTDKLKKRKKIRQKQLKNRLEQIKNWLTSVLQLVDNQKQHKNLFAQNQVHFIESSNTKGTTKFPMSQGSQKALKEAIQIQEKTIKWKRPLWRKSTKFHTNHIPKNLENYLLEKKLETSLSKISVLIQRKLPSKKFPEKLKLIKNKILFWSTKPFKNSFVLSLLQKNYAEELQLLQNSEKSLEFQKTSFSNKNFVTKTLNVLKIFQQKEENNLESWKKKQYVLSKRKQTRKVLKQLKKQTNRINTGLTKTTQLLQTLEHFQQKSKEDKSNFFDKANSNKLWNSVRFTTDFQTRRARKRTGRISRNRGILKKPTRAQKFQDHVLTFKKHPTSLENFFQREKLKQRRTRQRENRFWRRSKKPRYSQNRRKIKKRKRYSLSKLRLLNKEIKRVESYFKIRSWWWKNFLPNLRAQTDNWLVNVKNKKIREKLKLFSLNEIFARNEKIDLLEKIPGAKTLEIGNYDYKPLSLPEALFIRENFSQNVLESSKNIPGLSTNVRNEFRTKILAKKIKPFNFLLEPSICNSTSMCKKLTQEEFQPITENLIVPLSSTQDKSLSIKEKKARSERNTSPKPFGVSLNPIPFYAGWDETLRKFVVTNRLLSRRDAGYTIFNPDSPLAESQRFSEFTHYPLQGMNVATTLYWQVPFTTYDPDQFFALGRDGFAPIGWRHFKLGNTKTSTKPIIVKQKTLSSLSSFSPEENTQDKNTQSLNTSETKEKVSRLFKKLETKILNVTLFRTQNATSGFSQNGNSFSNTFASKEKTKSRIYFSQKRNKRLKRHPRSPVSFPSGALINQILPVHYIYVFYKRDRLPRDRYINRRLRQSIDPHTSSEKQGKSFAMEQSLFKLTDWTLRKRVKPRKKYHRKRKENLASTGVSGQTNHPKTILRRKFRQSSKQLNSFEQRQRPLTKPRLSTTSLNDLNTRGDINQRTSQQLEGQLKERYKKRKKNKNIKAKNDSNLRIRQLRRRIQRQVFRPVWRYGPNPGGYVWPGDYFRLELIKAPKLSTVAEISTSTNLSQKKLDMNQNLESVLKKQAKEPMIKKSRKRRKLDTWSIQPKKYLVEKHNTRVLRKRLQKSENKIKNLML